jgi:hypothetical protein
MEEAFATRSMPRFYNHGQLATLLSRVQPGYSNSTIALQVVGGDEKGTQCLGM